MEVRFAPQLSVHEGFGSSQVIEAVLEGLREAEAICQISWRVICCAMRHHTMEQNLEVFRTATEYLDRGVCAVDLAGDEASYPASQFTDLFAEARALGIPFTIHAGECHSTENVRTSIEMGAKRIGHGIAMKEDPELKAKVSYAYGKEKCYTGEPIQGERFFPGWLFEEDADYVQAVKKELESMGFTPKITKYNFCTNGSHYAGEANIKTIGMGPSVESLAHTVDEYCTLEALEKVAGCYYGIMKALLK